MIKNIQTKLLFILKLIIVLIVTFIVLILGINLYVKLSTKGKILTEHKIADKKDFDCILILGAGVRGKSPSPMLRDRLIKGIELYKKGVASKIIMSGDHSSEYYDEVNVMKNFAIEQGIPSEDIFMDHAGFSTYDSIYRARKIFEVKKMVIVTQEYHLHRALYISNSFEIEAYGVASKGDTYSGQFYRDIREIAARNKDFFKVIFKPKSTYLGEVIPVTGDGNITNDR